MGCAQSRAGRGCRGRWARLALGAAWALAGCTTRVEPFAQEHIKLEVELSTDAEALSPELLLTVVDAVQPSGGPFEDGRVRCGEISSLEVRPKYRLDSFGEESRFAGPFSVFRTPFTRGGTVAFPSNITSLDVNPWRAVLFQVEARAPTVTYLGLGSSFFLEGCACARLDPSGTHPDAVLDAEIKASCPPLSPGGSLPVRLAAPPPPPGIRLVICGREELLRIAGQPMHLLPGLCLEVTRCGALGQEGCFVCGSVTCDEIGSYQIPVIVRVGPRPEEVPPLLVAVIPYPVVPVLDLSRYTSCDDLWLEAHPISGDVSYRLPIRCVSPVRFAFPAGLSISGDRLVDLTMIPEERSGGAISRPARVAALLDTIQGPRLVEAGIRNGQLVTLGQLGGFAPGELPSTLHGYLRSTAQGPRATLAVGTLVGTGGDGWRPQLRLVEPSAPGGTPTVIATRDDACPPKRCGDACQQLSECRLTFTDEPRLLIRSGDVDGDGATDLVVASDTDDSIVELYGTTSGTTALRADCACGSYGQKTAALEVLDLGGPTSAPAADLAIGNDTVSVHYAESNPTGGPACVRCDAARALPQETASGLIGKGRFSSPTAEDLIVLTPYLGFKLLLSGDHDFTSLDQGPPSLSRQAMFPMYNRNGGVPAVGDFNGDGADDLAIFDSLGLSIMLGAGHSALAPLAPSFPTCTNTSFSKLLAGDLNGDGKSDLALVCQFEGGGASRTLYWLPSVER